MKLVDILARELKEWPDCEEIFQDYDGELRYMGNPVSTRSHCFVEMCDDLIRPKYGVNIKGITQPQWKEARDDLLKADAKEWNGEGLPPVGTVCEAVHEDLNYGLPCKAEILKLNKNERSAAFFWIDAPEGMRNLFWAERFLPIRTPEQIAAEERRRGISEISKILHSGASTLEEDAATLWDLGWRKQEPK